MAGADFLVKFTSDMKDNRAFCEENFYYSTFPDGAVFENDENKVQT